MAKVSPADRGQAYQGSSQQSLRFDDKATTVEALVGSYSGDYGLVSEEVKFIKNNIKRKECNYFIQKADQNPDLPEGKRLCQCNYRREVHSHEALENPKKSISPIEKWDSCQHTKKLSTNAYGEIEFVGYGGNVAKYVRIAADTPEDTMINLLTLAWNMEKPNLLISVTGGAKNFSMKTRLREVFRRGLMKAALSTGAWIVTGGSNAGVMKHVGEAVRDFGLTAEGRVMTIGIAPWGTVQNKEHLIAPKGNNGMWPANYRIEEEDSKGQTFLDPNHTHFILVDNGSQHQFAIEIPFRAKLEEKIANQKTDTGDDAVTVPVCLLVLEGGPGSLETVYRALRSGTPTVVIKGSGKTADILAYAYQNVTETEIKAADQQGQVTEKTTYLEPNVRDQIEEMIKFHFKSEKDLSKRVGWVEECVKNLDLLSVFELDSQNSAKDVDLAILTALLKAKKNRVMDQLKLALAWNRIDMAKSEIFTDETRWPTGLLDDIMLSAIQLNRVDFVELFLDHGVSLKNFLTVKRLLVLYNQIPENCLLRSQLTRIQHAKNKKQRKKKRKPFFTLIDVGRLIESLIGDFYQPKYLIREEKLYDNVEDESVSAVLDTDYRADTPAPLNRVLKSRGTPPLSGLMNTTLDSARAVGHFSMAAIRSRTQRNFYGLNAAQELFVWSVLMNHHKLSKLFWEQNRESATAGALFAHSVLLAMKRHTQDSLLARKFQSSADDYQQLSVGVINSCYKQNEKRTHQLLVREMESWGNTTCIRLAVQAENKPFVAQSACQSLFNNVWFGKMKTDNSLLMIVFCTIFFPLIPLMIRFNKEDPKKKIKVTNIAEEEKKKPALSRQATRLPGDPLDTGQPNWHQDDQITYKKPKGISTKTKLVSFYTSPIVKFCLNVYSYAVFLGLYSYILLVKLSQTFHWLEYVLIAWVVTIMMEEIRQFLESYACTFKSKVWSYLQDSWNILDVITVVLFLVGYGLRINSDYLEGARVVLSINLITFSSRILHIFSISKKLGPLLSMIYSMIKDLMWFVAILLVFIFSYAVASEAVLYPESKLSWKFLYYLPRKAYWHIYGELFLEDIEGENTCTDDPALYNDYSVLRCPSDVGQYFVPILLGLYILMTNVLLLNLLIAMFSYTFQRIQTNTDMHWSFQRFHLVHEYMARPMLPPPLIFGSHLMILGIKIVSLCSNKLDGFTGRFHAFRMKMKDKHEEKQLMQWEDVIADGYLNFSEKAERNSVEGRVKATMDKLDEITLKVDELQENQHIVLGTDGGGKSPAAMEQKLLQLETQMVNTTKALDWIMAALQENKLGAKSPKPVLPDYQKKKEEELQKKKELREQQQKLVREELEKQIVTHQNSRISPYFCHDINRQAVPDNKVSWEAGFAYNPPSFTSESVLRGSSTEVDEDLMALPPADRVGRIPFNQEDATKGVSRISFIKPYEVRQGLPINPVGRTGLTGRGMLWRWGPNHAADPVVTRWKLSEGDKCAEMDGKPVLEFLAIRRKDNDRWAIPGGICHPGADPVEILNREMVNVTKDKDACQEFEEAMQLSKCHAKEVYRGYADDPRNTDNAWLESRVVNYHLDNTKLSENIEIRATDEVKAVTWLTMSSSIPLHASHSVFLKRVADLHDAAF